MARGDIEMKRLKELDALDGLRLHSDMDPQAMGIDVSTKYLGLAGARDGELVFTLGKDISKLKDPVLRAWYVAQVSEAVVGSCGPSLQRVSVENPFYARNPLTGRRLQEVTTAASVGCLYGALHELVVENIDNNTWKSYLGLSGTDIKWKVKAWAHETYEFPEIEDFVKVLKQGKRKGEVERGVNDCYDAIGLATYALRESSNAD